MVVKVRECPSSRMPIELCYQCFGDPADGLPPVLLICGLNMQLYAWDEEFCETLVRAGFYVIRYDNRDMGHSTKIEHRGRVSASLLLLPGGAATWLGEKLPYNVEDMAADAWALLDVLNIPCAHLFGISMGGMIAQSAALLAPERTISLTSVMSSTNAVDLPQPQLWVKLWMLRKPPHNCTVDQLLEFRVNSLRRLLRSALPPDGEYLKKRYLMSLKRSSYSAGLIRQAAAIRRATGRDAALQHLCVPALVVHGAQDVVVPPMHGYRTATMLPYARMLVLKSMGHYFHPAFFSTIVEAFADMAASTDSARRGLGSQLPSAYSMQQVETPGKGKGNAEDGNASAAAAWRRGGGSVISSHANGHCSDDVGILPAHGAAPSPIGLPDNRDEGTDASKVNAGTGKVEVNNASLHEGEMQGDEVSLVDPKTLMMASMGAFIQPVVADASSPVGMAACRSVMVAVPGGHSNPGVPEAVIVENIFLRTPHAVPLVPTSTVMRKPAPQAVSPTTKNPSGSAIPAQLRRKSSSGSHLSPALSSTSANGVPLPGKVYASPLAAEDKPRCAMEGTTTATAVPKPQPMDGATPFIPCSPSRWHDVPPFPQRSTATNRKGDEPDRSGAAAEQSSSPSLRKAYPRFHPVVVGVPVEEYLTTHPKEREKGGLIITANAAAAAGEVFDLNGGGGDKPRQLPQKMEGDCAAKVSGLSDTTTGEGGVTHSTPLHCQSSLNESSWISETAMKGSTSVEQWGARVRGPAETLRDGGVRGTAGAEASREYGGARSTTSRSSSRERRENESFLHAQAPAEVVEATTLPSL
ncbi:Hydrolase-like protein [Leptomonas seymouri]|uniref:Hydrolase-like protein n=1 Tax=Leptomonas seymouri TaxID=5684 RepID=A0A0N1PBI2_LEPSE|nr:Hydrolase-like protein [Leptomonas seymouri]|eukprot:KPI83998.1 Hydrolase-like protein [Leptomonas seymouri]